VERQGDAEQQRDLKPVKASLAPSDRVQRRRYSSGGLKSSNMALFPQGVPGQGIVEAARREVKGSIPPTPDFHRICGDCQSWVLRGLRWAQQFNACCRVYSAGFAGERARCGMRSAGAPGGRGEGLLVCAEANRLDAVFSEPATKP
jgi:hypothetical protein